MSAHALTPGAKPANGGIDYTNVSAYLDIERWADEGTMEAADANWELLCEAEEATMAAMPDEYLPDEPRFKES